MSSRHFILNTKCQRAAGTGGTVRAGVRVSGFDMLVKTRITKIIRIHGRWDIGTRFHWRYFSMVQTGLPMDTAIPGAMQLVWLILLSLQTQPALSSPVFSWLSACLFVFRGQLSFEHWPGNLWLLQRFPPRVFKWKPCQIQLRVGLIWFSAHISGDCHYVTTETSLLIASRASL